MRKDIKRVERRRGGGEIDPRKGRSRNAYSIRVISAIARRNDDGRRSAAKDVDCSEVQGQVATLVEHEGDLWAKINAEYIRYERN